MKKTTKYFTASLNDKLDSNKYSIKFKELISESLPNNIHGMLASATEHNDTLVFFKRWHLGASGKNDYYIYDSASGEFAYKNIALLSSAVKMLWYMNKPFGRSVCTDRIIYSLDQEYFRCLEDIKFFKSKISSKPENLELYQHRLSQSRHRLDDIKTEISKIY